MCLPFNLLATSCKDFIRDPCTINENRVLAATDFLGWKTMASEVTTTSVGSLDGATRVGKVSTRMPIVISFSSKGLTCGVAEGCEVVSRPTTNA